MSAVQQIIGLVYVCVGLGALVFLIPAVQNVETTGSRSFAVFTIAVAGYTTSSGVDLFTTDYALSVLAHSVTNCAGVLVGVSWLFLAIEVSERVRVTRRLAVASAAYVLSAWLFALRNPGGLVLRPTTVVGTQLELNAGIGFWFLLCTAWVQVLVGSGLLVVESLRSTGLRRKQTALLASAIVPALAASVATALAQTRSVVGYDYTVFGWVGTLLLFAVALYSSRFLRLETVARRAVVEETTDAMVTVDNQQRVVDANPRAVDLFDVDPGYVGLSAAEFFAPLPDEARERLLSDSDPDPDTEVTISSDGDRIHLSASVSTIDDARQNGRVLVFRDITDRYRQRERTRRERDLKETIRDILVHLSSRREIEQALCDRLLTDRRYSEVWIADRSDNGRVVPRTYAGEGDDLEPPTDGESRPTLAVATARKAIETGEVAVERRQSDDGDRSDTRGQRQTVAASPLAYNELTYGAVVAAAPDGDGFGPDERQLLTDLGESVAFAINAAEQQKALQGDTVRTVTIQARDPSHHLLSVIGDGRGDSGQTDAAIQVHEVRNADAAGGTDDGSPNGECCLQFLTTTAASAEQFVDRLADRPDVRSVTVVAEDDSSVSLRLRVSCPTVGSLLANTGGKVRTLRATDGHIEAVADFSPRTDLDRVLSHVRDRYEDANLVSVVTDSPDPVVSDPLLESLTQKQREALEAAYHSGFFDRPQRQTATEVAQDLGVTRSTFLSHLRTAEHEVLGAVVTRSYRG